MLRTGPSSALEKEFSDIGRFAKALEGKDTSTWANKKCHVSLRSSIDVLEREPYLGNMWLPATALQEEWDFVFPDDSSLHLDNFEYNTSTVAVSRDGKLEPAFQESRTFREGGRRERIFGKRKR